MVGIWTHSRAKVASWFPRILPFSEVLPRGCGTGRDPVASLTPPSWLPGYSEDGGALRGEVIPEHEFATGPVCLDDENEFPPVSIRNP